ncbi:hypothetical protein CR513_61665, partial [Mucuna pruriens]
MLQVLGQGAHSLSVKYSLDGERDLLMVRRLMSVEVGEDDESQRKSIFHSHSCCRTILFNHYRWRQHPRPYKL